MAITRMPMPVTPDAVFDVLADGHSYARWLVGAKRIRAVDNGWPAEGTRIHHTVGMGPLTINDTTHSLDVDRPRRLVLQARAWPSGEAQVTFAIEPVGDGCVVVLEEHPVKGPAKWINNPLLEAMTGVRNRKSLQGLCRLISEGERRPRATGASG